MPAQILPCGGGRAAVPAALSGTRSRSDRRERGASGVRCARLPRPLAGVRRAVRLSASPGGSERCAGTQDTTDLGHLALSWSPKVTPCNHVVCLGGSGCARGAEVPGFGAKGGGVIIVKCGPSGGYRVPGTPLGGRGRLLFSGPSKVPLPRRRPVAVCLFYDPALLCNGKSRSQSARNSQAAWPSRPSPRGLRGGDSDLRTDPAARARPRRRGPAWRGPGGLSPQNGWRLRDGENIG